MLRSLLSIQVAYWFLLAAAAFGGEPATPEATPAHSEYLERWTPGGDTNDKGLPYPHNLGGFQSENDADWVDDRWQRTAKGPFVAHSILLAGVEVGPKLTAVEAGVKKHFLYDLESGTFVAGVAEGELKFDAMRFGMLNRPLMTGDVAFHIGRTGAWRKGTLNEVVERSRIDHQGLYLHDDRVLLATRIDGVDSLEAPVRSDAAGVVVREFELGPRTAELWTAVATGEGIELFEDGRRATWRDQHGNMHAANLAVATSGVRLMTAADCILLRWPAAAAVAAARLQYERPNVSAVEDAATKGSAGANELADSIAPVNLTALKEPGRPRWGEPLVTQGEVAADGDQPFVVDRIPPPFKNPFGALFFIAGLDFFPNGDAAVCTVHGDVWIVRGLDATLQHVTWRRFATGLYQPLGLEVVDGNVIVVGRDQVTRLHDQNSDGEADFYESFNHDLVTHGLPHAYAMRLERTPDGAFVFLCSGEPPHGSALLQLSADGEQLEVLARGFRHPFGLGAGPNGEITAADNEGNWVPSSKIDLIEPGGFYGFLGSATERGDSPPPLRPLCFIPKVADNSSGGQFWYTGDAWGPYHRGGMFHFSWGRCTLHAVLQQLANDVPQAATVEIPGVRLTAGPAEAEFSPRDGQLYVVGLDGWQTAATADGSFERIRSTGKPVMQPSSFAAFAEGVEFGFEKPLDPASLQRTDAVRAEQWNYNWSPTYGSYHYSVREPDRVGHDRLNVERVTLSDDRKRLFLQIADLQPVDQLQVSLDLTTAAGQAMRANVYATLNALPARDAGVRETFTAQQTGAGAAQSNLSKLLAPENLVAWCIVPFDAKQRGPEERAAMLAKLGINRVAYDWRDKHVPQFDEELDAYKRYGVELHAFWTPINTDQPLNEHHWPLILDLVDRHDVTPELWVMLNNALVDGLPAEQRATRAAEIIAPAARAAAAHNCQLGLYNHGGWFGDPDNQIAIIAALQEVGVDNVGIVYNFHHGHEHMQDFAALAKRMAPFLLTVNVNGMRASGPQIATLGGGDDDGAAERGMLEALATGYTGPIGILGHREERDVEECLREGLAGARRLTEAP